MTDSGGAVDTYRLAEAVRQACLDAALAGYENAAMSGLCPEGAWEAAIGAIRSVDIDALGASSAGARLLLQRAAPLPQAEKPE